MTRTWSSPDSTSTPCYRHCDQRCGNRSCGWDRKEWEQLTGCDGLGERLPDFNQDADRSTELGMAEKLALQFGELRLAARAIEVDADNDPIEVAFDQGWTDGLPIVPPTDLRVARMLAGTTRKPDDIIGLIPPNLSECTVEKAAINAVMAGCRPEYFPVVLSTIEAALRPEFSMHGLLCTLWFAGPVVIVNGPITKRIGMNSQGNALGQGNRANATIGRALQLLIRNVGGGNHRKLTARCSTPASVLFAEDEVILTGYCCVARGATPGSSAVTLSMAMGCRAYKPGRRAVRKLYVSRSAVCHPKLAGYPVRSWCSARALRDVQVSRLGSRGWRPASNTLATTGS